VPGHGAKRHPSQALSGKQPDPGHCGIAPLINEPNRLISLAAGLPPLVHPPASERREEYNPLPTDPPASSTRHPAGCLQPVLLRGRVDHIDGTTGELLHRYTTVHEPGGVLPIACKTRRASKCPPCAEVYRADTYQLIRAGLSGGKGIPGTVAAHPCMTRLLLTVPEAAEALAISRSKLYELLASGAVASIRIDGSRRIPLSALQEYVSKLLAERKAA
jgi:excisionase family DNA binding protein